MDVVCHCAWCWVSSALRHGQFSHLYRRMMTATKAANPTHRPSAISVCDMPEAIIPCGRAPLFIFAPGDIGGKPLEPKVTNERVRQLRRLRDVKPSSAARIDWP